jgi:O-antigen ligase/tetratricopeptide (TPR) repeat protein
MSKASHARRAGQTGKSRAPSHIDPKPRAKGLDSYLSGAILVLACFILFLPLVVNYSFYYPYIFLKSILFRLAVEVMVLIYVILAVHFPIYRPRINLLAGSLLAYFGAMFISSLPGVSVSPWSSWWGEFARMGGMFTQLHLLAYFFVLLQVVKRERDWLILFTASLFFGVLMGLSGLVQFLGMDFIYKLKPGERLQGATGNANWFPAHMVFNLFIVIWFLGQKDKKTIYDLAARYWLVLLGALDLFLILWEISAAGSGTLSSGLALASVAIFAAMLHISSLFWFFMRGSVRLGTVFLGVLGGYYFFWIYQSRTRGAMIGLIGALTLLLLALLLNGAGGKMRRIALVLLLIVILVPSIIYVNRGSEWVRSNAALSRFTLLSAKDILWARYWPWKASVLATLDHPFLGWGLENYKCGFDLHYTPQVLDPSDPQIWFDRAHNVFLDVSVTTGFIGLALYLTFYALVFGFLIRQWLQTKDPTGSLLMASLLLAYLFQSLATFDTVNTDAIVYLVLAYVAWLSQREIVPQPALSPQHSTAVPKSQRGLLCIAGAIAVLLPAFWFLVWKPAQSNLLLNLALEYSKAYDPRTRSTGVVYGEGVLELFQRASDYQTTGRYQVREELSNYTSELALISQVPLEDKTRAMTKSISLLQESIQQEPLNARHYMYLVSLINRCFDVLQRSDPSLANSLLEKNMELLQRAERLSPTRPQLYFEMAQTLGRLGRTEDRVAALEKGLALNPPNLPAGQYFDAFVKNPNLELFAAYFAAGKYEAAAAQLKKTQSISKHLTRADYDRVISLYYSKRQFEPIVRLYKEQLVDNPNDTILLARLAATYRDMGEVELARQTAMKAASLSPQLEAGLKTFLESLDKKSK